MVPIRSTLLACAALSSVMLAAPGMAAANGYNYQYNPTGCCYFARPAYAYLGTGYYVPPVRYYGYPRPYEAYIGTAVKGRPGYSWQRGWFQYYR